MLLLTGPVILVLDIVFDFLPGGVMLLFALIMVLAEQGMKKMQGRLFDKTYDVDRYKAYVFYDRYIHRAKKATRKNRNDKDIPIIASLVIASIIIGGMASLFSISLIPLIDGVVIGAAIFSAWIGILIAIDIPIKWKLYDSILGDILRTDPDFGDLNKPYYKDTKTQKSHTLN